MLIFRAALFLMAFLSLVQLMPIPALNRDGLLPPGVHDCMLDDLKIRFGAFQNNDRRPQLFSRFEMFVSRARQSQIVRSLVVDGSFVTAKPVPNDIDLIVIVGADHELSADLSPLMYSVVSKKRVQRTFGFDILAVREGTPELDAAIGFFEQVRGWPGLHKGLLKVQL